MKKIFFAILFLVLASNLKAQKSTIVVKVYGIENTEGVIQVGLYNNANDFPTYSKVYKGVALKPNKEGVKYTFKNIPAGKYAVAVWHDEDEDKKIDKNFLGAPTENYGFSLNKFGMFGPPKFTDVSFYLSSGSTKTLKIYME